MELQKDYILIKNDEKQYELNIFRDSNKSFNEYFVLKIFISVIFDILGIFIIEDDKVLYYNTHINILYNIKINNDVKSIITNIPKNVLKNDKVTIKFVNKFDYSQTCDNVKIINLKVDHILVKGLKQKESKPYFKNCEINEITELVHKNDFEEFKRVIYNNEFGCKGII